MKNHFGRFSANSKSHHWASVKWTKSVYLSSETLLFPHAFSLNIIMLLLHSRIQQMENKFILAYFLNTEHAAGKITGGDVYSGCMIQHWIVVKIMLHFTAIPWGKVHFRSSRGNQILSLKNFGFLSTVTLHLRDVTDRNIQYSNYHPRKHKCNIENYYMILKNSIIYCLHESNLCKFGFRFKTFPCYRSSQKHPKWNNLVLLFKSHSSHEVWP